jgi:peroxiredoxin
LEVFSVNDSHGGRWIAGGGATLCLVLLCIVAVLPSGCGPENPSASSTNVSKLNGSPKTPKKQPAKVTTPTEQEDPPGDSTPKKSGPVKFKDRRPADGAKEAVPVPADATRELHEPLVALSEAHAERCVVKVGDTFPELKLPEVGGSEEELSQHFGEKLTVVVFWNARKVYAAEQFANLQTEVAAVYGKFGVNVVAVNVGDSREVVARLARQHEIDFPCLLDMDGGAFKLVGKDKLPRTYLLDSKGKIVWFDIEYSQTTQYELNNAVFYFLKNEA